MSVCDAHLLDLLSMWWRIESQYNPVEGYPSECPSCAGYQASRQYDDGNGAIETDTRGRMALHIGRIVAGMPEPYRTALYLLARNRATGVNVWVSARIPEGRTQEVTRMALDIFGESV